MAKGDPITTPWFYDSGGDYQGNHLTITVDFDNVTRAIQGATIHRDAGCAYVRIYVGLGPDGTPNSTTHVFAVPNLEGDRHIGAAAIAAAGITTIEGLLALGQITAGP